MQSIGTIKAKGRDLQIQLDLDARFKTATKELGQTAVQYLLKELPLREFDIAESFKGFTVWLVAEMIKNPFPIYQIQIQWGLTENVNHKLIIGEKNKSLGWKHVDIDFSDDHGNYKKVTYKMAEISQWIIKDFRRYGFVQ